MFYWNKILLCYKCIFNINLLIKISGFSIFFLSHTIFLFSGMNFISVMNVMWWLHCLSAFLWFYLFFFMHLVIFKQPELTIFSVIKQFVFDKFIHLKYFMLMIWMPTRCLSCRQILLPVLLFLYCFTNRLL